MIRLYGYWFCQLTNFNKKTVMPWLADWKSGSILVLFLGLTMLSAAAYIAAFSNSCMFPDNGVVAVVTMGLVASLIHYLAIDRCHMRQEIVEQYEKLDLKEKRRIMLLGWAVMLLVIANATIAFQLSRDVCLNLTI